MLSHMSGSERSRIGFVLAGGKSSRMGTSIDKAFLDFRGQTLLERALTVAGTVCDRVTIVGDPAKFEAVLSSQFSVLSKTQRQSLRTENRELRTVIADIFPGCGPLAGIHAALTHSTADLNLMLAVDMPFVSSELLAFLFTAAEASDAVIITVPRTSRGFQPLCAVYRRDFSTVAEQALRAGKYKVDAAFSGVSVRVIEENELATAGFSEQSFFNVNTPQDRLAAEGGLKPT
ncbi:MAG: molybdenum cofactor guanylyltransferase [Terriglobales bacterium]